MSRPLFSIISPSFRSSQWLRLCIASVHDQTGVSFEHLIQDSLSDDQTGDWLPSDSRVQAAFEKDRGMYDGINRGLRRAQGEFLAYLNCDEQYLPGALASVAAFFLTHPEIDVVVADVIVVDRAGTYRFHRKTLVPNRAHTLVSHLSTPSCALFFRRRLLDEFSLFFDPSWRVAGDAEWMGRVLQAELRVGHLAQFTSVFTDTGANMSLAEDAHAEGARLAQLVPAWMRFARPGLVLFHRFRKLMAGSYFQAPFRFALYTLASPSERVLVEVKRPTFRWRWQTNSTGS